jgi:homopolymeric O-antigen transport system ATP-binding protein
VTLAISLEEVSKRFRIPMDRSMTLKARVVHFRASGRFRDLYALRDVSLEIPFGRFTGIIGPNGCGKSTLLKLLAGIYPPTSGRVTVTGRVSPFLELGVGFNPELTARENVFLNGAVLGLTRRDLQRRLDDIIAFAELEQFADQKLKNFSSGMQVRLAFAVAIQADAGILLMDEVLAVGDARFQERCFDVFNRFKREGRTVVLVTHDLGACELYCDSAFLLDQGRLVAQGLAGEVCSTYRRMVGERSDADAAAATSATAEQSVRDAGGPARWGTGEVRITDVELLGPDGARHHTFPSGKAMVVRVHCEVVEQVDDLICGIHVHRGDGYVLAGTNTFFSGYELVCPPAGERFSIDWEIDELRLLGGHYRLSATLAAHPTSRQIDCLEQAFEFRVMSAAHQIGLFSLGTAWRASRAELRRLSDRTARRYELEASRIDHAPDGSETKSA